MCPERNITDQRPYRHVVSCSSCLCGNQLKQFRIFLSFIVLQKDCNHAVTRGDESLSFSAVKYKINPSAITLNKNNSSITSSTFSLYGIKIKAGSVMIILNHICISKTRCDD